MRFDPKRYRREVLKTRGVSDATRVMLLVMLDEHADARGYVRVSRAQLATRLGRDPREVTTRVTMARDSGWLGVVERGRAPNIPATWALVIGREERARSRGRPWSEVVGKGGQRPTNAIGEDVATDEGWAAPHQSPAVRPPGPRGPSVGTCRHPVSDHDGAAADQRTPDRARTVRLRAVG